MEENNFYVEDDTQEVPPSRTEQQRYEDERRFAEAQAQRGILQNNQIASTIDEEKITSIVQTALFRSQQQAEGDRLIREYSNKYPAFQNNAKYISLELQALQQEAAASGKALGQEEALLESIKRYEKNSGNQVLSTSKNAQEFKREPFGMDLGGSRPPEPAGITAEAIERMTDEEFAKFDASVKSGRRFG